jgi:hypothetical protein
MASAHAKGVANSIRMPRGMNSRKCPRTLIGDLKSGGEVACEPFRTIKSIQFASTIKVESQITAGGDDV